MTLEGVATQYSWPAMLMHTGRKQTIGKRGVTLRGAATPNSWPALLMHGEKKVAEEEGGV